LVVPTAVDWSPFVGSVYTFGVEAGVWVIPVAPFAWARLELKTRLIAEASLEVVGFGVAVVPAVEIRVVAIAWRLGVSPAPGRKVIPTQAFFPATDEVKVGAAGVPDQIRLYTAAEWMVPFGFVAWASIVQLASACQVALDPTTDRYRVMSPAAVPVGRVVMTVVSSVAASWPPEAARKERAIYSIGSGANVIRSMVGASGASTASL
jgi:hypothetical protein